MLWATQLNLVSTKRDPVKETQMGVHHNVTGMDDASAVAKNLRVILERALQHLAQEDYDTFQKVTNIPLA